MGLVDRHMDEHDAIEPQLLREANHLARSVALLAAERRAQAKAIQWIAGKLPPELVTAHLRGLSPDLLVAHLRGLPDDRREYVVRELSAMAKGSVLG